MTKNKYNKIGKVDRSKFFLKSIFIILLLLVMYSCKHYPENYCHGVSINNTDTIITKIAFGSCAKENEKQPILYRVIEKNPDVFVYLGDNIYGDTDDMEVLRGKYALYSCKSEFIDLWNSTQVIGTWDDHDYGRNDAGREYPYKAQSKEIFLDFFKEPAISDRRNHEGIYTSYYFGDTAHRVQIILLDTRTFRSNLILSGFDYAENFSPTAEMLGTEQWNWLEQELLTPAKIRIIGTSTQFSRSHNGYEAWANFPNEKQRMINLIQSTNANGVLFISGDIHFAEFSVQNTSTGYPLYDLTSSGISSVEVGFDENTNRIGEAYVAKNFGMIEIQWLADPIISFNIYGNNGGLVRSNSVLLSNLHF